MAMFLYHFYKGWWYLKLKQTIMLSHGNRPISPAFRMNGVTWACKYLLFVSPYSLCYWPSRDLPSSSELCAEALTEKMLPLSLLLGVIVMMCVISLSACLGFGTHFFNGLFTVMKYFSEKKLVYLHRFFFFCLLQNSTKTQHQINYKWEKL